MRETLSTYKFKKIAIESLRNGLRLHFDSLLLYYRKSYPSALQLSILAMEEIAKAKWVEHYYDASVTNQGFPEKDFEQKWLKLLYFHPEKQYAFFAHDIFRYSPKFVKYVKAHKLEEQKQKATYVGLSKKKGGVDVNSRISIPLSTKEKDARKIISIINDELKDMCRLNGSNYTGYFSLEGMNVLLDNELLDILDSFNFKSGIKSDKWFKIWTNP